MKVCCNCKTQNDDNSKYCRHCGKLMDDNHIKREPEKDVSGWWYLLAFILFLLWIGIKTRIISL